MKRVNEEAGKLTQKEPAPFRKPTAKKETHNSDFVQSEPVGFKKPKEAPEVDEEPKAEAEQKKVLDRNEEQAEISAQSCSLSDILESVLRKMNSKRSR